MYCAADNSMVKLNAGQRRAPFSIFAFLLVALLFSVAWQSARAQPGDNEYQVKAAFLFHFAQLVEWPAGALNASDQSINLCIFDDEPHRRELETTIEGKPVGARVMHVRILDQGKNVQECNILFLSRDEDRREAAILKSVRDLPVLTVGDADNFLAEGGMIHFRMDRDRIRFDINAADADASHLRISSRLLLLATSVTPAAGIVRGKANYAH